MRIVLTCIKCGKNNYAEWEPEEGEELVAKGHVDIDCNCGHKIEASRVYAGGTTFSWMQIGEKQKSGIWDSKINDENNEAFMAIV